MTGLIVGTPEEGLCQMLRAGGNWNPAVHLQTAASVAPPSARVRSALLALDVAFSSLRTELRCIHLSELHSVVASFFSFYTTIISHLGQIKLY